jgi:hypothetical protein
MRGDAADKIFPDIKVEIGDGPIRRVQRSSLSRPMSALGGESMAGFCPECRRGFANFSPLILLIAMIWLAHIGFDRALGYGLKYESGFGFTHMGRIGKLPN